MQVIQARIATPLMEVIQGVHVFMNKLVHVKEFLEKATVLRPGEFDMLILDRYASECDWWNGHPFTSYYKLVLRIDCLPARVFLDGDRTRAFDFLQLIMKKADSPKDVLEAAARLRYIPIKPDWMCVFGFRNVERILMDVLSVTGSPDLFVTRFAPRGTIIDQKMKRVIADLKVADLVPSGLRPRRLTMTTGDLVTVIRAIPQRMLLYSHNQIVAWISFQAERLDPGYVSGPDGCAVCHAHAMAGTRVDDAPPQAAAASGQPHRAQMDAMQTVMQQLLDMIEKQQQRVMG